MPTTTAFEWIRTSRRAITILVAVALALTILVASMAPRLVAPAAEDIASQNTSTDIAADDGGMSVAGLSWSRMVVPGDPGGGMDTLGLSWS